MSDLWEKHYNNGNLYPSTFLPNADPDQDGWDNLTEAVAGTDPVRGTGANGILAVKLIPSQTQGAYSISWPTIIGKRYRLQASYELDQWFYLSDPIIGVTKRHNSGVNVVQPDSTIPPKIFWRVVVSDLDQDSDGLTNAEEQTLGTNPETADTDADGWTDLAEILVQTNPLLSDSDYDGIPDNIDTAPLINNIEADPDGYNLPASVNSNSSDSSYAILRGRYDFERLSNSSPSGGFASDLHRSGYPNTANALIHNVSWDVFNNPEGIPSYSCYWSGSSNHAHLELPSSIASGRQTQTWCYWIKMPENAFASANNGKIYTLLAIGIDRFAQNVTATSSPLPAIHWYCDVSAQKIKCETFQIQSSIGYRAPLGEGWDIPAEWNDGKWHHIALHKDKTKYDFYFDGVPQHSWTTNNIAPTLSSNSYTLIGRRTPTATTNVGTANALQANFFPAGTRLDRLRIYSRISSAQILSLAQHDADGDGIEDYWENSTAYWNDLDNNGLRGKNETLYLLHPLRPQPINQDTDLDGLTDVQELKIYKTLIAHADTDADGLPDGWEITHNLNALNPDSNNNGTADGMEDSDGDGVTNQAEYENGTNPGLADTDNDKTKDGIEIQNGTDPTNPAEGGTPDGGSPALPEDRLIEVPFTLGGDYAKWEIKIEGKGPHDTRVIRLSSNTDTINAPALTKNVALRQGNKYEITLKWSGTKASLLPAKWYCWQAQIDGKPLETTFTDYQSTRLSEVAEFFTVKNHWVADNRDGILSNHCHMQEGSGGNVVINRKAILTPMPIVSRDKFLAGSLTIPTGWSAPCLEVIGPDGNSIGKYQHILGGGATKVYNHVKDMLAANDPAASSLHGSSQKIWFVKNSTNARVIDFFTTLPNLGEVKVKLWEEGYEDNVLTFDHTLKPEAYFAQSITYVNRWINGTAFELGEDIPTLSQPLAALAQAISEAPAAIGLPRPMAARAIAQGVILSNEQVLASGGSVTLSSEAPLESISSLGSLQAVTVYNASSLGIAPSVQLLPGQAYWLSGSSLRLLSESAFVALNQAMGDVSFMADEEMDGEQEEEEKEQLHPLLTPCMITLFHGIDQVEAGAGVVRGFLDGVIAGLEDDWKFISMLGSGVVTVIGWEYQLALNEINAWRTDPKKRAQELKALLDALTENLILEPLGQLQEDFSSWEGMRNRAIRHLLFIHETGEFVRTIREDMWDAMVDGFFSWAEDFYGRMLTGAEKTVLLDVPWERGPMQKSFGEQYRLFHYTFGYTFGYLGEQVVVGALSAGTLKVAQVAIKGGVTLAGQVAARTTAVIAVRGQFIKKILIESGLGDALIREGYKRGMIACAVEPVGPTLKEVTYEVIERAFARPGYNRTAYGFKQLQDDMLNRPNLQKLCKQVGKETLYQKRLAQLQTLLGDDFNDTIAKNFAKVADEFILIPRADNTVDEFFEGFFRSMDGNPSLMKHADDSTLSLGGSIETLTPNGKARLKQILSDPDAGNPWKLDTPDEWLDTPPFPSNFWARGLLLEIQQFKKIYKPAGYTHHPTAAAYDFVSAAEYVQLKTLKNPDGAFSAMKKAVDALAALSDTTKNLKLHINKKPGSTSTQLKASLDAYIETLPTNNRITVIIEEYTPTP